MKSVRVREHWRRPPNQSKKKGDGLGGRIMLFACFGVLIIFALYYVLYLISRIPVQVFYEFFGVVIIVIVAFITLIVYRLQRKLRQNSESHAQPAQTQYQSVQPMAYQGVQEQQHQAVRIENLGAILMLTPPEFEEFVGDLLRSSGYTDVQRVGRSGDLGVDVSAKDSEDNSVIVQCKRFGPGRAVGSVDMQKFLGVVVMHYKAKGIFVTTSTFTQSAKDLAKDKPITLIDGDLLLQWIRNTRRML